MADKTAEIAADDESIAAFNAQFSDDPNSFALPVVTIFGGGIAGLSTAHELIERGFTVQVVESARSKFGEYECEVGGLAANQHSRVPASVDELHGDTFSGYTKDEKECLMALRRAKLSEAQPRFPLLETIRFDRAAHGLKKPKKKTTKQLGASYKTSSLEPDLPPPGDWTEFWDDYGTLNAVKLARVLKQLRDAYDHYLREFRDKIIELSNTNWTQFLNEAHSEMAIREVLFVKVTGYTDTDGTPDENRELAQHWANEVRDELLRQNAAMPSQSAIPSLEKRLQVEVVGSADPKFNQSTELGRRRSNRVEFEVVEQLIPGEHGFRFFPNFYRHLFDTMKRTPLLDAENFQTGRTAYEQLVATPGAMLAMNDGKAPVDVNLRGHQSAYSLDKAMKIFFDRLGFDPEDMIGLQFFTARWMTSCSLRRRHEGEPQNFVQYIGGRDRYSKGAWDFINKAPRALAAMSATESDARTQFDIAVQLMGLAPDQKNVADMTLNGPTNTAWLDYWKAYLKVQGVRFFTGSLDGMALDETSKAFVPSVSGPDGHGLPLSEDPFLPYLHPGSSENLRHRFVVAMSYQHVSDVVAAAYETAMQARLPFTGPFRQLLEFDRQSDRRNVQGDLLPTQRSAETGAPLGAYPLRTISGLQFFFPNRYRIGSGNLYFPDSPWGLTSISQFAYWRNRIKPVGQFLGQISVDVGDWHEFYPNGLATVEYGVEDKPTRGHCAWRSSASEIAMKTWDQIKNGLQANLSKVMAAPGYFHIDRNIVFYESDPVGFSGSLVIRAVNLEKQAGAGGSGVTYGFKLSRKLEHWSPFPPLGKTEMDYEVHFDGQPAIGDVAENIAAAINDPANSDQAFFAMASVPKEVEPKDLGSSKAGEVIISPYTKGKRFSIWMGTVSDYVYQLAIDGEISQVTVARDLEDGQASADILSFDPPLRDGVSIRDVHVWDGGRCLRFEMGSEQEINVSAANFDGQIEVTEGAALSVQMDWHSLQLARQPSRGSGVRVRTAVRANARLSFEESGIISFGPPEPGRIYAVNLSIQDRSFDFSYQAKMGETWEDLQKIFYKEMQAKASDVVLSKPIEFLPMALMSKPSKAQLNTTQQTQPKYLVVTSPLAELTKATITVAPMNKQTDVGGDFILRLNDWVFEHKSTSTSQKGLRDSMLAHIQQAITDGHVNAKNGFEFDVAPLGKTEIEIALVPKEGVSEEPPTFLIGVLHERGMIELVGAPALDILCKDVALDLPKSAFVPFRNDGEFLINRPHQWKYRPGLYDKKNKRFVSPHDPDPENRVIHYGHSECPPLRRWTGAGTYMATYTRMTTMEAANESGRHAVISLLHDLIVHPDDPYHLDQPTLPSSFPQIWDPEDMEPQDLIFFKEIDEALCREGLPHLFDIIGLTRQVLAILSHRSSTKTLARQIEQSRDTLLNGLTTHGKIAEFVRSIEEDTRKHLTMLHEAISTHGGQGKTDNLATQLITHLLEKMRETS